MDDYLDLETTLINLKKEQNSDPLVAKVTKWSETGYAPTANFYSTGDEQKYLKQLRHFFPKYGNLQDDTSPMMAKCCTNNYFCQEQY